MACNITDIDSIPALVESAIEKLGGLHYLVNCAGLSADGKLHETDLSNAEAILDTNLRAQMHLLIRV